MPQDGSKQKGSQNANMRGIDTLSAQTFSESGEESTMQEVRGYFRIFARLFGICYPVTVCFPCFFHGRHSVFSMRDTWATDSLHYPDEFPHTSIPSDLIQRSIFILRHIEITFLCDQEYLYQGRQSRGGLESINVSYKDSRNSRAFNKRNGLSSHLRSVASLSPPSPKRGSDVVHASLPFLCKSVDEGGGCFWCYIPPVIFFLRKHVLLYCF